MTVNDEQLKLKIWMEDYALYRMLEVEVAGKNPSGVGPDFSGEPPPGEGQIRLWPAEEMTWPPMYGMLMRAGYGTWRVFPFSELSTPATPGEMTVRSGPPARVIQGWNARELVHTKVLNSWVVDTLPDEKLFEVNRWWLILESNADPGGDLKALCGPPLRHPLDPRHEYLDAEASRADSCLGETSAVYQVQNEQQKAAEPESGYGSNNEIDPSE